MSWKCDYLKAVMPYLLKWLPGHNNWNMSFTDIYVVLHTQMCKSKTNLNEESSLCLWSDNVLESHKYGNTTNQST